nr:DUF2282 domain-containing protein [Marivita sp. GX14005]
MISAAALSLLGAAPQPAYAQAKEKCYGVVLAGENDGLSDPERNKAGSATVDYQGNAWVLVDADRCLSITLPPMADGTPRRGALEPLDRDRPED